LIYHLIAYEIHDIIYGKFHRLQRYILEQGYLFQNKIFHIAISPVVQVKG